MDTGASARRWVFKDFSSPKGWLLLTSARCLCCAAASAALIEVPICSPTDFVVLLMAWLHGCGAPRFCWVTFKTAGAAKAALSKNGTTVDGFALKVEEHRPRAPRPATDAPKVRCIDTTADTPGVRACVHSECMCGAISLWERGREVARRCHERWLRVDAVVIRVRTSALVCILCC